MIIIIFTLPAQASQWAAGVGFSSMHMHCAPMLWVGTHTQVRDEAGLAVSRAALLQLERRMVAKSVLYCLTLDQRAGGPETAAALVELALAYAGKLGSKPGVRVCVCVCVCVCARAGWVVGL
jgi:hypothetical protein